MIRKRRKKGIKNIRHLIFFCKLTTSIFLFPPQRRLIPRQRFPLLFKIVSFSIFLIIFSLSTRWRKKSFSFSYQLSFLHDGNDVERTWRQSSGSCKRRAEATRRNVVVWFYKHCPLHCTSLHYTALHQHSTSFSTYYIQTLFATSYDSFCAVFRLRYRKTTVESRTTTYKALKIRSQNQKKY